MQVSTATSGAVCVILLYVEILKSTRFSSKAIVDHVLSIILFIAMMGIHRGGESGDLDLPDPDVEFCEWSVASPSRSGPPA